MAKLSNDSLKALDCSLLYRTKDRVFILSQVVRLLNKTVVISNERKGKNRGETVSNLPTVARHP